MMYAADRADPVLPARRPWQRPRVGGRVKLVAGLASGRPLGSRGTILALVNLGPCGARELEILWDGAAAAETVPRAAVVPLPS